MSNDRARPNDPANARKCAAGFLGGVVDGLQVRTRPSLREQLEANDRAQHQLAAASGREVPPRFLNNLAPKREIRNHADPSLLEGAVKREVARLLAIHPTVYFAMRQNSGAAVNSSGAPVWFYQILKSPGDMTIVDFTGWTKMMRPIAFECKRVGWKYTGTEREKKQRAYMKMLSERNGVTGFITDVMQAKMLLDRA